MNHELSLNTDTAKIDNKPVSKVAPSLADDKVNSSSQRAFSSELSDQVSQQTKQKTNNAASVNGRSDIAALADNADKKAEASNHENGKALPDIAIDRSALGQTVADIVKQVPPEDKATVKEALFAVLGELKNQGNSPSKEITSTDKLVSIIEQFAGGIAEPATQALELPAQQELGLDKLIQDIDALATVNQPEDLDNVQAPLLSLQSTNNKGSHVDENTVFLQLVQQIKELTTQIKETVASERLSVTEHDNKFGKTVADWVKKVGQLAKTISGQATPPESDASLQKNLLDGGQDNKEVKIRPDILQALANKVATDESKQGQSALGNKVIQSSINNESGDNKATERVAQLVDLFKPEKQEPSSITRTLNDKGREPTFGTVAANPTSITTPLGSKAAAALDIQPTLHSQAWNKVVSSRVVWMAKEGVQQASLHLNPANLGPVEVRVSMQNDQTNVVFLAQNAITREALEQALPRLRESFADNGLELADANVADQFQEQANSEQADTDSQSAGLSGNSIMMTADADETGEVDILSEQESAVGLSVYA